MAQVRLDGRRPDGDRHTRVLRRTRAMADCHLGLPVVLGGCARIVRTAGTGHGTSRAVSTDGRSASRAGRRVTALPARAARASLSAAAHISGRRPDPYNVLTAAWSGSFSSSPAIGRSSARPGRAGSGAPRARGRGADCARCSSARDQAKSTSRRGRG